jgi:ribokinase
MEPLEVIGLGGFRQDDIYGLDDDYAGSERPARLIATASGGPAINTIFSLARLGLKCGVSGAVGADTAGGLMLDDIRRAGIDTSLVTVRDGSATDKAIIVYDQNTASTAYHCYDAGNTWIPDERLASFLAQASVVHIAGLASASQLTALSEVIARVAPEVRLSLMISEREAAWGIKAYAPLIGRSAVVFAGKTAIERLTGKNFKRAMRICRNLGAQAVAVFLSCGEETRKIRKKGKAACVSTFICNHEYECMIESAIRKWPNIVEITGAQDAFAAGFIFGMVKNKGIDECGFIGDIVAQFCLKTPGARDSLPDPRELTERFFQIHREELII